MGKADFKLPDIQELDDFASGMVDVIEKEGYGGFTERAKNFYEKYPNNEVEKFLRVFWNFVRTQGVRSGDVRISEYTGVRFDGEPYGKLLGKGVTLDESGYPKIG